MKTPGKLSSCLWERSIEFQGKTESKPQRKAKGERGNGGAGRKTKWNTKQTRLVDVWRFLGVAESIRPWLFLVIPLFFTSVCPGAVKRRYNSRHLRRKSSTTTDRADFPCSRSPLFIHFPRKLYLFIILTQFIRLSPSTTKAFVILNPLLSSWLHYFSIFLVKLL